MKKAIPPESAEKSTYLQQNKIIHMGRYQLGLELDDCREFAWEISGKASISSLSLKERSILIAVLKKKGANLCNPPLPATRQDNGSTYQARLKFWNNRFPINRPGYASNKQLALIESLWVNYFNDGRAGSWANSLRGFIWRQTKRSRAGPVSDLAFLKGHHVAAIMAPLKEKRRRRGGNYGSRKKRTQKGTGKV